MIKKLISFLLAFSFLMGSFGIAFAVVHVNGYYRKNGTYVAPYTRTSPNSTKTDNYSYPGNYNPNTGKITPGGYSPNNTVVTIPAPLSCPAGNTLVGSTCYSCPSGYSVSSALTCIPIVSLNASPASASQTPEAKLNAQKALIVALMQQIKELQAKLAAMGK
jgi:hypothetical protein